MCVRLLDVYLPCLDPIPYCSLHFFGQTSVLEVDDAKTTARATSLIQTYVPRAFLKASSGRELSYIVPKEADRACFKGLFQALEQNLHRLHLTGYGVSDATLEEVPRRAPAFIPVVSPRLRDELWGRHGQGWGALSLLFIPRLCWV